MYERHALSFPGAQRSWVAAVCGWVLMNKQVSWFGSWSTLYLEENFLCGTDCVLLLPTGKKNIYWNTTKQFLKSALRWLKQDIQKAEFVDSGFILYHLLRQYMFPVTELNTLSFGNFHLCYLFPTVLISQLSQPVASSQLVRSTPCCCNLWYNRKPSVSGAQ